MGRCLCAVHVCSMYSFLESYVKKTGASDSISTSDSGSRYARPALQAAMLLGAGPCLHQVGRESPPTLKLEIGTSSDLTARAVSFSSLHICLLKPGCNRSGSHRLEWCTVLNNSSQPLGLHCLFVYPSSTGRPGGLNAVDWVLSIRPDRPRYASPRQSGLSRALSPAAEASSHWDARAFSMMTVVH